MTSLKQLFKKLPAPLRAGVTTAVATFLGLFIPSALGWGRSYIDAVTAHGVVPKFSVLASAAVAAGGAAITGLGNYLYRLVQSKGLLGLDPKAGPVYDTTATEKPVAPVPAPQPLAPDPSKIWTAPTIAPAPTQTVSVSQLVADAKQAIATGGPTIEQFQQLVDWLDEHHAQESVRFGETQPRPLADLPPSTTTP